MRGTLCALLVLGAGCQALTPQPATPNGGPLEDGNSDPAAVSSKGPTRGEPNDSFGQALVAVLDATDQAHLQGTIAKVGDLDVFNLGILRAGDRILVDTDSLEGPLDISIALYDEERRLFIDNDDREQAQRPLDAYIDEVARHTSEPYYLVVGGSTFAGSNQYRVGSYRVAIEILRGGEPPEPVRQTLRLKFDGGTVNAPTIPVSTVGPFDAAEIDPRYAGQTETIKASIVETVLENFAEVAVDVVTSDDPLPEGPFSTVLFGGRNPIAFGIAESVDHYNQDPEDMVVIFTESFQPEVFSAAPSAEELGIAIGNIASHEAGHVLGLNHVDDPTALMDAVSPADTFLEDQEFKLAPLSEQILPIGFQDALTLLAEIVGLA
ncbi:MAG: matrixin family metalloprotease [bacterium]|nr:matrixin family metalloprotease [bacterium]